MKYNLLESYRLERRLAKVESILLEQTTDEINQDLFSRNLDEVKAAVDAGQDVNQMNDKGQTPLLFAASSRTGNNSDIIEYLLNHGADLNSKFNDLNAFQLACKNRNVYIMKAILANDTQNVIKNPSSDIRSFYKGILSDTSLILLAASKERYEFDINVHRFYCDAFGHKAISKDQYKQIINVMLDNCKYVDYSVAAVRFETKNGILDTVEKIADKEKILIDLQHIDSDISEGGARQLLELCHRVSTGELSVQCGISVFISVCKFLCKKANDQYFMSNLINPRFLSSLKFDDIKSLFLNAAVHGDVNILSKLVSAKVKLDINTVLDSNYLLEHADAEISRLIARLIDKSTRLNKHSIDNITSCSNKYLINYVIDMGYGEELLEHCIKYGFRASRTAIKVLKENGFEIPDDSDSRESIITRVKNKQDINEIIMAIEEDNWTRRLEEFVNSNPEILLDSSVIEAIENNDTATSRRLKRKIANNPKNGPVYDF